MDGFELGGIECWVCDCGHVGKKQVLLVWLQRHEWNMARSKNKCYWWCPVCKVKVPPKSVTYEETHDERDGGCGEQVFWDDDEHNGGYNGDEQ